MDTLDKTCENCAKKNKLFCELTCDPYLSNWEFKEHKTADKPMIDINQLAWDLLMPHISAWYKVYAEYNNMDVYGYPTDETRIIVGLCIDQPCVEEPRVGCSVDVKEITKENAKQIADALIDIYRTQMQFIEGGFLGNNLDY